MSLSMLRPNRLQSSLILLLLFQPLWISLVCAENENGYLSPPELYKLVEESETTYRVDVLEALDDLRAEDFASLYWPSTGQGLRYPWIALQEDGGRSLQEYDLGEGCKTILAKAEPHFDAERYEKARKLYLKATKKYPKCYLAFSSLGDTYYFEGDALQALSLYDHSLELNPHDFRGHFYKANTLFKLARFEQARREYISALAIKPHRESITRTLRDRVPRLGERFIDRPFMPQALARQEDGHIGIYSPPSAPHWMTYGLCKAVWIGETAHREARTGNTEHVWSLVEERQCLLSMLEMYYSLREEGEIELDPDLERIFSVAESGMLDGPNS